MELLVALVALGLFALLAARFGYDTRPGLRAADHGWADVGQPRPDEEADRRLALELRQRRRPSPVPAAHVALDEAAFAAVGLRLETSRARAFAAALCRAAAEERAAGDGGWPDRAVDRLVRAVSIDHLARVVEDLGLGRAAFQGDGADADAVESFRALLTHLLRGRVQDALRLQAGLRPFWTWSPATATGERIEIAPARADAEADGVLTAA